MRQRMLAAIVAATLLSVFGVARSALAAPDDPTGTRHSSGLLVLPAADRTLPSALAEATAQLLHAATQLAQAAPADFAYPWVDPAGEVVVDTTTARGVGLLGAWQPGERAAGARQRPRSVKVSMARFEQLRGDVVGLTSKTLPGQQYITQIKPDGANNRLVLSVSRLDDDLLNGLARRYGTDVIAVRYEPDLPPVSNQSRESDTSGGGGFYGGANVNGCTSAFSWYSGSTQYMLSAGHCFPNGGGASTPVESMGTVTQSSRENWNNGTGTVPLTGQTVNRGDMALIQVYSPKQVAPYIYSGGYNSSSARPVREMWNRMAAVGDQFCTGGRMTGEQCGFVVTSVRYDQRLSSGEWSRNTNSASKQAQCNIGGDSGGPVYTVRGDGGVAAKGIHNWAGGGGSDHWGGFFDPCSEGFTDIWDAYYGFPGFLKVL